MKIIFTAKGENWSSPMDARFGRANLLVVYDEEKNTFDTVSNSETENMGHGAGLQTSQKVIELNPDVIITGNGAGEKALDILKRTNIKTYIGAGDMSLVKAYQAYKDNKLQLQY